MDVFDDLLQDDDFVRLYNVAKRWEVSEREALQGLKSHNVVVYALLFNVSVYNMVLGARDDGSPEVTPKEGPIFREHFYMPLSSSEILNLIVSGRYSCDVFGNWIGKDVREFIGCEADPCRGDDSFDISTNILYVRKSDALILEKKPEIDMEASLMDRRLLSLDTKHRFHAKELKIAVEAWFELYEKRELKCIPARGHKKYIQDWLGKNYPGLSGNAIDRISTVINPNHKGGATPTG